MRRIRARLIGTVAGFGLFTGFFLSPALPAALYSGVLSNGEEPTTVRHIFYDTANDRLRDPTAYGRAVSLAPSGNSSILLLGSSELSAPAGPAPGTFFPWYVSNFDVFMSGRGYTQSLYHAVSLSAIASQTPMKKVTLIVSPQWFTADGASPESFQEVFSASQYQAMQEDPQLPEELKQRLKSRVTELVKDSTRPGRELGPVEVAVNARVELAKSALAGSNESQPYRVGDQAVPFSEVDWDAHLATATAEGEKLATNDFWVRDDIFAEHLAPTLDETRGSMADLDYSRESPEYDDLVSFLDVAKAHGIEVLLISVPMHGRWYDHTGYPAERRQAYYERIRQLATEHGATLADLTGHEYDPHFFYDTLHLGWKGWIYVNKACVDFATS